MLWNRTECTSQEDAFGFFSEQLESNNHIDRKTSEKEAHDQVDQQIKTLEENILTLRLVVISIVVGIIAMVIFAICYYNSTDISLFQYAKRYEDE